MTIINNTYSFIFIHIPKNAGTTVNTILSSYTYWSDIELGGTIYGEALAPLFQKRFGLGKHTQANRVRNLVGDKVWEAYFKFAFVRNPYSRTFSTYRFLKKWRNWAGSDLMEGFQSFEEFLTSDLFDKPGPDSIFLPQFTWLEDVNTNNLVDFVGKVETISSSLQSVSDRTGVRFEAGEVQARNESGERDEFRTAYTEKSIEIVRQRYSRDFSLFGYSLDINEEIAAGNA